jgi:putative transcriptional regulator
MDKEHFDQLVKGVKEMKRHIQESSAGKTVRGVVSAELPVPDVRVIREAAHISQSQFAKLIGVNLRTLQNWEQHRTRPTGPARALLKIVASSPQSHRGAAYLRARTRGRKRYYFYSCLRPWLLG